MTQSVQVNPKLPDLASPFLYSSQEEVDQPASYSVQTPYGFQLDLDFLKYVEEIESGHNIRRAAVTSRRSGRALKTSQRCVGGRTSGWTSTESLASPGSEDGRVPPLPPPRNRLGSAPSEVFSLSPVTLLSVPPLSAGAKVPPPPPQRNPRVERTLLETSRRLQQEQSQHNGGRFQLADPPKQVSTSASAQPLQTSWIKPSPQTSGLNTPTAVPPSQLQTVREQMATALRQLKEMEERVKGVPALEKEVAELRAEKDMLMLALQEKKATMDVISQPQKQLVQSSTQTIETSQSIPTIQSQLSSPASPDHKVHGKSRELKNLAQKFEGKENCAAELSSKIVLKATRNLSVEKKSVAVGDDQPIDSVVFYYSHSVKDAAVGAELHVCEKGTGTENPEFCEEGTQVRAETREAGIWVMESQLGLASETQREMDTLQDTIKFQQESIASLESQLSMADKDLGTFRAQIEEIALKVTLEKGVLAKPDAKDAQIETTFSTIKDAAVLCRPVVMDVCVGNSFPADLTERGAQTDAMTTPDKTPSVVMVTVGCQYENMIGDKIEDENVTVLKKRQLTINDYKIFPEEAVSMSEEKEEDPDDIRAPSNNKTGMLKSIMKRKDGNGAGENRTSGKKSLQFVGILNGGYESTSSEEEEDEEEGEEGSSSEESGEGDCLDSTEEDDVDPEEETSEEERKVNIDESDTDEEILRASNGSSEHIKEKFELSSKMREACLILKNHLNDDIQTLKSKEVLASTHTVQLEWFRVSSGKMAQPSRVSDYLMAFSEVSALLLEHIVNMTDGNGNAALHYSVSHSNFGVVDLLLDTDMCCVDKQNKAGYTAIMLAALSTVKEDSDMSVVKKLFSKGNVNAKASQAGQTALMLAVSHGRQEMVEALLECGGDVNVQDDEGSTALMCASEHGRAEIVKLLLEQPGCDIAIVDNDGSNALSIALEASHNDTAVLLYAHMNYAKTPSAVGSPKSPRSPTGGHKSWPAE
ncbi:KN motif and ankyrin repeat domain-containing protein 3 [Syngnathoides biaculeatus]|uniref:KN motif and ankyrin repeat domain-containing protein 3 n=1 Tax=Syngnathoides biaculeatus TaxID=300417 RepID=UPI002ADE1ACE|nr:KN motif and ankyrin repeat domain-containing protein 3 [Syngnathoides biaculeatus]